MRLRHPAATVATCLAACALLLVLEDCQAAESLYNPASFRPLVADRRAAAAGDIVTVLVYESSSATTTADTNLNRNNTLGIQAQANARQHGLNLGVNNDFDGGGRVQRAGRVLAQLSVAVTQVDANGDLWIRGEQEIELNSDRQHIRIEGRVRPADIANGNSVQSNRIADLKLSYVGNGDLAERQRPGFWSRVMTWLGF
ncbi:flagellar basal body L-ring protein FlgH [Aquabacterium humicola]|uniref:flagellar basal body L-ring protein FlgH n=1 Tax=Aquabacterium humicola TaxID=3237377 RepID=UPI0025428BEA|nr:flagellar basal body L-ring protein FlgH [Rubrivivax pictus]